MRFHRIPPLFVLLILLCARHALGAEATSTDPALAPGTPSHEGPVVGPAADSLERLLPHARGVFLAVPETVVYYGGGSTDIGRSQTVRLRVLSRSGVATDAIGTIVGIGNVKDPASVLKWINPPERRLKITVEGLRLGRRYWFATADPSDYRFYPQGIMNYWPADSAGVPPSILQAVETNAYRWQPELRFPDLGVSFGYLVRGDSTIALRVWKDRDMLWEHTVPGSALGAVLHRAYAFGWKRPTSVEADSVILASVAVRVQLRSGNEFGVRPGTWRVETIYRGYTGQRLAVSISIDDPQERNERVYRSYDPKTGAVEYERFTDILVGRPQAPGIPDRASRRKVERWMDPATGQVVRELVFAHTNDWHAVDHDLGIAAGPVGFSSMQ